MTRYNSLNVKLSNSQLNKLKSAVKNEIDEIQMMRLIFLINYCKQIDKLQIFVKLLLTTHQLILTYQKLNYLM